MRARLALLLLAVGASYAGFCDHSDWAPIFVDEFDTGSLDATSWTALNGTAPNDSSCRDAMCLADNVRVENGALILTARRQESGWAHFTTGAVNSRDKRFFQATQAKPFRLEQDIFEMINGDGVAHATYHVANSSYPSCKFHDTSEGGSRPIAGWDTAFHEYAIERTVDSLAFVYDGAVVYNSTQGRLRVLDVPWYAILNFAVGGPWPKPVNGNTVFPAETKVDYVRVSIPK